MWAGFMEFRSPTSDEARLLRELATIAGLESVEAWVSTVRVRSLNDGGMGSIALQGQPVARRPRQRAIICRAAVQFTDEDGVEVIASLNADEDGVPFELDMWKTDFSPLIRIPKEFRPLEG